MIEKDGFYWVPVLPREIAIRINGIDESKWPKGVKAEYDRNHRAFTRAKNEYRTWIRKDRDSRMSKTAKEIATYILDCLNHDTGRCDPSYQAIADELGIGVRTVERWVPKIAASGWMEIIRRGKTTTNFYRWRVSTAKVNAILELVDGLRDQRQQRRDAQKRFLPPHTEPPKVAGHSPDDPSPMAGHEPSKVAGHEPPEVADKYMKGTSEAEYVNKGTCSGGREESLYGQPSHFQEPATFNPHAGNRYLAASRGEAVQENDQPFPVPSTQSQAESIIDNLCRDRSVSAGVRDRMMTMLQRGLLTPVMADRLLRTPKEHAA